MGNKPARSIVQPAGAAPLTQEQVDALDRDFEERGVKLNPNSPEFKKFADALEGRD